MSAIFRTVYQDRFVSLDPADALTPLQMRAQTDKYFTQTAHITENYGDRAGLWAVYVRVPATARLRAAVSFVVSQANQQGARVIVTDGSDSMTYLPVSGGDPVSSTRAVEGLVPPDPVAGETRPPVRIFLPVREGAMVAAKDPLLYYYGAPGLLSELETGLLQRVAPPLEDPADAYAQAERNAREMVLAAPDIPFLDGGARHCPVDTHAEFMRAVARGSQSARGKNPGAVGFTGSSSDEGAAILGIPSGGGTMPHALIGYAGSTLRACEMFHAVYPDRPLTALVDFFAHEVSDSLEVAARFRDLAQAGRLAVRLDTDGERYMEELDAVSSRHVIEQYAPHMLGQPLTGQQEKWLYGPGVSVAAVFHMRSRLDGTGFSGTKITASSGFSAAKCRLFMAAGAPIDSIVTGSYLPGSMHGTFAKSETLGYDAADGSGLKLRSKAGREWTLDKWQRDARLNAWSL